MRSGPIAAVREGRHTPERKKKKLTCAEQPNRQSQRRQAHAKKEKARADVCGAAQSPPQGKAGTRRKEKARNEEKRMKKKKKQGKKRKWLIPLAVVLLAAVVFSVLVGTKVIRINTLLAAGYPVHGIDVSHYQGEIDWAAMKQQGMDFAYIKATEGSAHEDECFDKNWEQAKAAGMICGAYHFFSFESEGAKQAEHFIKKVGDLKGSLIPVVDVEYYGKYVKTPPDVEKVRKEVRDMIDALEGEYGEKPMIYCTYNVYRKYIEGVFDGVPLWIRNVYYPPEDIGRKWTLWQYTDRAQLDGYQGEEKSIDCNVFQGEKGQLNNYVIQ